MKKPNGSLISYFSQLAEKKGGINLAQGIPGFSPPSKLIDILNKVIYESPKNHQYPNGNGEPELVECISHYYSPYQKITSENILITQGATEAVSLVFLYFTDNGEKNFSVLSFDPPYESYPALCDLHHLPFHYFDYNDDLTVDFSRLEKVIRENEVKLAIVTSPGNPLGKIWTKEELTRLDHLSKKHECYLLFDGVYKDLYFDTPPFLPLELENERLIYVDSFSKTLSITGWRIGYIIAEESIMEKLKGIHDFTGLCAPSVLQKAITRYLKEYNFGEEYSKDLRETLNHSFTLFTRKLKTTPLQIPEIKGGYFLWAGLPDSCPDGFSFAQDLFDKTKVAVVPGENFSPYKKNYVRLNFVQKLEIIEEAGERIANFGF
ncbi:MAG: pyridoxal phosphate-dependent aminotransferase [bacterium]